MGKEQKQDSVSLNELPILRVGSFLLLLFGFLLASIGVGEYRNNDGLLKRGIVTEATVLDKQFKGRSDYYFTIKFLDAQGMWRQMPKVPVSEEEYNNIFIGGTTKLLYEKTRPQNVQIGEKIIEGAIVVNYIFFGVGLILIVLAVYCFMRLRKIKIRLKSKGDIDNERRLNKRGVLASWEWSQQEWDRLSRLYQKVAFSWKTSLIVGAGGILILLVRSYMTQSLRHSGSSQTTSDGSLWILLGVLLPLILFFLWFYRWLHTVWFPIPRVGQNPIVIIGVDGIRVGNEFCFWNSQGLQLIAVELVKPPNQNQPYAIHIDIGWVFGAGKIIIPVPVNNRDQAEQIVNKLSNQISTVVTKASKSEETEEGTGINPTFRFWINIIGFAFLIYFLILNIPGMANTLKLLASTVIVIISVVGLFISFIFKKGKK